MGGLFSSPKIKAAEAAAAPAAPAPTVQAPEVQQAARNELKTLAQAAGRGSTILTSGQGVLERPTIGKKTLLGE